MNHGILGGTFNPPHLGHLVAASEAADQLGLDRVLLMPVAEPPHKDAADDPGPEVVFCPLDPSPLRIALLADRTLRRTALRGALQLFEQDIQAYARV